MVRLALALLVRDGLVLLVHRTASRARYPDRWDLVGGHVELGESPLEAIARECLEEIGVRVRDPQLIPVAVSDPLLDVHAFLVSHWEGEPVNAAPEEHDHLRWFRPDELAELTLAHPTMLTGILSAVQGAPGRSPRRTG
jgi:8-oxo-dGTP diphosphatase